MIDHTNTTGVIICPHCGHIIKDYRIGDYLEGEEICDKCGGEYKFSSDIIIYWSTEKIITKEII